MGHLVGENGVEFVVVQALAQSLRDRDGGVVGGPPGRKGVWHRGVDDGDVRRLDLGGACQSVDPPVQLRRRLAVDAPGADRPQRGPSAREVRHHQPDEGERADDPDVDAHRPQ